MIPDAYLNESTKGIKAGKSGRMKWDNQSRGLMLSGNYDVSLHAARCIPPTIPGLLPLRTRLETLTLTNHHGLS